jgi:hypothetical protein
MEKEWSPRVLVSSRSNVLSFGEWLELWWGQLLHKVHNYWSIITAYTSLPWKMPKGYHVLLGWNLKGIRETLGVLIYDCQLVVCVSTPIESLILEQDLSSRVLVSSRSNILWIGLSWGGGSCYMGYFFLKVWLLCAPPFLNLCPVWWKHYIVFD